MIRLTSSQYSPEGRVLHHLFYGGVLEKLLTRNEYSGCPHHGGEHALVLHLAPNDAQAFFGIIEPLFPNNKEGIAALKMKFVRYMNQHLKEQIGLLEAVPLWA